MSHKWYIGQPIVAIKNSNCGRIKKGQEFTIKGLMGSICKCGDVLIDIGLRSDHDGWGCFTCNTFRYSNNNYWKKERLFAPMDIDISELTDILKEPIKEFIER
jgi:hypothetical protein